MSLFHMSIGMNMANGMNDCPFMLHEEVLCPMNLAEHLGALKSMFMAVVPTISLLLAAVGVVALLSTFASYLRTSRYKPVSLLQRQLRERVYSFSHRPLQELFANGILHPKLF